MHLSQGATRLGDLFRRHPLFGAFNIHSRPHTTYGFFRQPEVNDFEDILLVEHDVLRLQVAVHNRLFINLFVHTFRIYFLYMHMFESEENEKSKPCDTAKHCIENIEKEEQVL